MQKLFQASFYSLILIFIIFALIVLFLLRYQPLAQFAVVSLISVLYFLTGVLYHAIKKDLTKQIIFEFLGIAALAIFSFGILTFWRLI